MRSFLLKFPQGDAKFLLADPIKPTFTKPLELLPVKLMIESTWIFFRIPGLPIFPDYLPFIPFCRHWSPLFLQPWPVSSFTSEMDLINLCKIVFNCTFFMYCMRRYWLQSLGNELSFIRWIELFHSVRQFKVALYVKQMLIKCNRNLQQTHTNVFYLMLTDLF